MLYESDRRADFNSEEFFPNIQDGKDVSMNESNHLNTSAEPECDELEGPLLASGTIVVLDEEGEKKPKIGDAKRINESVK